MADERVAWDGSLPSFMTPATDPQTGQWSPAWRPIIELMFQRTGGDFDAAFRAVADADVMRSQFAEISRSVDILAGQVASLRDDLSSANRDDARLASIEATQQSMAGRLSALDATASDDDARYSRIEGAFNSLVGQFNGLVAMTQAENIFANGENQDVSFKKITVNNTANLKGNATIAGSGYQLGFFSYGGELMQTPTFANVNGAIGGLTISNPPTQAEVQALRDACETLADGTRNVRAALQAYNLIG
jgi:hypothetical protein